MNKPNSALKHMNTKDLMEKYYQQIENAVYSAEITCQNSTVSQLCFVKDTPCIFRRDTGIPDYPMCDVHCIRRFVKRSNQDDIPGVYCDPCNRTSECGECLGPDVIGEEKERLK